MVGLYTTVRWGFGAKITRDVPRLLGRPPISMDQYVADYAGRWRPSTVPLATPEAGQADAVPV